MGAMEIVEDRKGEGKVSRRAVVVKAVVRAFRKEEAGKEDHPRAKDFKACAFNATKQDTALPNVLIASGTSPRPNKKLRRGRG